MSAETDQGRIVRGEPSMRLESRWRNVLFGIGDLLFLVAVGVVATLVMHGSHQLGWNFAITCLAGMAAAMLVQMVMAFCVAPILGSIESMVPSMFVGMVSPMAVCALHLLGHEPDCMLALAVGAMSGAAMFVFVQWHSIQCRSRMR